MPLSTPIVTNQDPILTSGLAASAQGSGGHQKTLKVDYRIPIMIGYSDPPDAAEWEPLRDQWEIVWYAHFSEPIIDEFNNYPKRVFRLLNTKTRNDILMGVDDALYLFPDKEDVINRMIHRFRKACKSKKEDPLEEHKDRLFFNLESSDFELKALRVLKDIPSLYVMGTSLQLASILHLREFLTSEEHFILGGIIDKLDRSDLGNLTPRELNFSVYKPQEPCVSYLRLARFFPHLQAQIDDMHTKKLDGQRSTLWSKVCATTKPGSQTRINEFERLLNKELEKLRKSEKLSFLRIYEMECHFRERNLLQAPVFN